MATACAAVAVMPAIVAEIYSAKVVSVAAAWAAAKAMLATLAAEARGVAAVTAAGLAGG